MVKETIEDFFDRIYICGIGYSPRVLVFKSKQHKQDINSTKKPDIWSLEKLHNYINYLKE